MTDFLRVLNHLLPTGRAWRLAVGTKLHALMTSVAAVLHAARIEIDRVFFNLLPEETFDLEKWSNQFALPRESRELLDASWKALGGQSPYYIQSVLRAAGFDVYVHEWWGSTPPIGVKTCVAPRDPRKYLKKRYIENDWVVACGENEAACGEPWALSSNRFGNVGYPLVNKILESRPDLKAVCGRADAQCGTRDITCNYHDVYIDRQRDYIITDDSLKHRYFLYIGGKEFPEIASVPVSRKAEFEALCLKIKPAHLWLALLVEYNS